jgi:hypothetical protein
VNQGYFNDIHTDKESDNALNQSHTHISALGRWLLYYLTEKNDNNFLQESSINLFASDLAKSYLTLWRIWRRIYPDSVRGCVFILPCSHELDFKKSTTDLITKKIQNCDAQQLLQNKKNKMMCSIKTCQEKIGTRNHFLALDWRYYNTFYGNSTRAAPGKQTSHCRNTSMIGQIIHIIKSDTDCDKFTPEHNTIQKTKKVIHNIDGQLNALDNKLVGLNNQSYKQLTRPDELNGLNGLDGLDSRLEKQLNKQLTRLDGQLEKRLTRLDGKVEKQLTRLDDKLDTLNKVNKQFNRIGGQLDKFNNQFNEFNNNFINLTTLQ